MKMGGNKNGTSANGERRGWKRIVEIYDSRGPIEDPTKTPEHQQFLQEYEAEQRSTRRSRRVAPATARPTAVAGRTEALDKTDTGPPAVDNGSDLPPINPPKNGVGGEDGGESYDVERLNREYALVKVGSQAAIFQENPWARLPEHQLRMLSVETFKVWLRNRRDLVRRGNRLVPVTWANRWLDDPRRRQYEGIEFFPDPDNKPGSANYLNLWRGFAVNPAQTPDSRYYKTFRDHLLKNVCGGDQAAFNFVFGFFAHMVQRPRERLGVALVLRGKMGTGKTKVGEVIGSLFPRHWFLVDSSRYVIGQFNAYMASCLLLQADEAMFAGDKEALGRLRGLITSAQQFIEAKGIDPVALANYVRVIFTSNEDWVVPAGKDERRFAVFNVDARCAQNHDYFRKMDEELAAGGLGHLLADLLRFDLSTIDLRKIPRTDALLEQKIRSLDPLESWWHDRLIAGAPTRANGDKWLNEVARSALYADYIAACEQIGVRRKQSESVFGTKLKQLVTALGSSRPKMTVEGERGTLKAQRVRCYLLPSLAEARADFDRILGQHCEWPDESEPSPSVSDPPDSDVVDL
jgi:hypothetical protein